MTFDQKRMKDCLRQIVRWSNTDDPEMPMRGTVEGKTWILRVNDFPAEPLFTLFIDGEEIGNLDDWPEETWQRE